MKVENLSSKDFEKIMQPATKKLLRTLSKSDLLEFALGEQHLRMQYEKKLQEVKEEKILIEGKYVIVRSKLFLPSSEKSSAIIDNGGELTDNPEESTKSNASGKEGEGKEKKGKGKGKGKKKKKKRKLLPSERYPNAKIVEEHVTMDTLPQCPYCTDDMYDTGLTSVREKLTVIPKQYYIKRIIYHTYGCKCHGSMVNTPTLPQIAPGSVYSDEMTIDFSLSKYCDLIPMQRYVSMASRGGFPGLPANSLIDQTHQLAFFLLGVYKMIKDEVQGSWLNHADETTHRMLEGDERSNWYLWAFTTQTACYFECHNTRSGDVASSFFNESQLLFLMSDVYSGYSKALRESNKIRKEKGLKEITSLFCNAHARRKFVEALKVTKDAKYFIGKYSKVYQLEKKMEEQTKSKQKKTRKRIRNIFKKMKRKADKSLKRISTKSTLGTACKYFIKNFKGLINFTYKVELPIDNNHAERLLRAPVVGRKTWSGTHSKQGAETAAILFTIIQSCHLNKVNPREYFPEVIKSLHETRKGFTPYQYSKMQARSGP